MYWSDLNNEKCKCTIYIGVLVLISEGIDINQKGYARSLAVPTGLVSSLTRQPQSRDCGASKVPSTTLFVYNLYGLGRMVDWVSCVDSLAKLSCYLWLPNRACSGNHRITLESICSRRGLEWWQRHGAVVPSLNVIIKVNPRLDPVVPRFLASKSMPSKISKGHLRVVTWGTTHAWAGHYRAAGVCDAGLLLGYCSQ